jgi:hypothetical protein
MRRSISAIMLAVVMSLLLANIAGQAIPATDALCFAHGMYNMQAISQGDNLYILWEHDTVANNGQGDHYILFKRSTDNGKTFGETTSLYHSSPLCTAYPHMAVEGSNVYVMWEGGDGNVLFKASNDDGTSFGSTIPLGKGILGSAGTAGYIADGGKVLASGNRAYVVWNDDQFDIILRKSDDGGKRFGDPVNISKNVAESINPRIAISSDDVYVVWLEDMECAFQSEPVCSSKALFAKSDDSGRSFGDPVPLDKLIGSSLSMPRLFSVAADGTMFISCGRKKTTISIFPQVATAARHLAAR